MVGMPAGAGKWEVQTLHCTALHGTEVNFNLVSRSGICPICCMYCR